MNVRGLIEKITYSDKLYAHGIDAIPKGTIYTCINPYSYHIIRENDKIYSQIDGIFIDGMTMCWWIRLLWGRKIKRLSFDMTGIAKSLFSKLNSSENKESVYFIGARQSELDKTLCQIKLAYPNINIAGSRNGYFENSSQREKEIEHIVFTNPSYVIVGMGAPLQEIFASDLKYGGYKGVVFTCGGFLHQTSESINYYPEWVNRLNLRAFYRLFNEKNLFCRLYNVLLEFPLLFTWDTAMTRLKSKN